MDKTRPSSYRKTGARRFAGLLLIVALAMVISGCGLLQPITSTAASTSATTTATTTTPSSAPTVTTTASQTTATTATTASSTTASAPTTTASSEPTPTTTGVTERRLGIVISTAMTGSPAITIDYVEFYTGEEAIEKALEDGSDVVEMDEYGYYIPNDYYIRNNNPRLRTFLLTDNCQIRMFSELLGPDTYEIVTYERFSQMIGERTRLMTIQVVDGRVSWMDEFYTP